MSRSCVLSSGPSDPHPPHHHPVPCPPRLTVYLRTRGTGGHHSSTVIKGESRVVSRVESRPSGQVLGSQPPIDRSWPLEPTRLLPSQIFRDCLCFGQVRSRSLRLHPFTVDVSRPLTFLFVADVSTSWCARGPNDPSSPLGRGLSSYQD